MVAELGGSDWWVDKDVSVDVQSVVKPQKRRRRSECSPGPFPSVVSGEAAVLMGLTAFSRKRSVQIGPDHRSARPSQLIAA